MIIGHPNYPGGLSSSCIRPSPPFRPQPRARSRHRFNTLPLSVTGVQSLGLGFASGQQARHSDPAETGSLYYGLVAHIQLLPTPLHRDAVSFCYRPESACLEWTFTTLTKYTRRRTGPDNLLSGSRSDKREPSNPLRNG